MENKNQIWEDFIASREEKKQQMLETVGSAAKDILPILHLQAIHMISNMNLMNQMAFDMFNRFNEQQAEFNDKWYEMLVEKITGSKPPKEEPKKEPKKASKKNKK